MKILSTIRKILFKQELLYLWFLFIMLLPCIVLSMTEPMSIWVSIASVLLPLGIYGILFNLFRKPGYFLLFCFILLLINGYQLVLIYLFNESVVSPDMFLNIVTTNSGESGELMRTIWPAVFLACLLYFSAVAMAIVSICNKEKLNKKFIRKNIVYSFLFLGLGCSSLLINEKKGFSFQLNHDIYPINALYNLKFAITKYSKTVRYNKTSSNFTFNAHRKNDFSQREIVLLVVGETTRAANWQLWGYNRPTNPFLSKRNDVLLYKDMLTQGNTTHKIVPIILSRACAENFECIYSEKSIIAAFKEAGFHTIFVSNQIPDRAFIDAFASQADTTLRLSELSKNDMQPYDNDGIPVIESLLKKDSRPTFIVYHTYGSHFEYSQRYAPQNAIFKPHVAGALRYKERPIFLNAYDNTVCNVDRMLNDLINVLDQPSYCSSMIYLSDHGEDLMDDKRRLFLHCSPIPTYYQMHIPMVVWLSSNFKNCYPEESHYLTVHQNSPSSSNVIFHTLLDVGQIQTTYLDSTLSLANKHYNLPNRHFIDEHDEPLTLHQIGLKEEDWNQFKEKGIEY